MVEGGPSNGRIKREKKAHSSVRIEESKFLPGYPEFRMEPDSFRRIERSLGMDEKALVLLHGLPLFDHSVSYLLVIGWVGILLNYKGAFDDRMVIKRAAQFRNNVNSF